MKNELSKAFAQAIKQLVAITTLLLLLILMVLLSQVINLHPTLSTNQEQILSSINEKTDRESFWSAPDINSLENHPQKAMILYGKELIANTSIYLGIKGKVAKISNGMNCQNCHLEAGTKVFGNNYGAVFATYPKFRARSGTVENIYKRINDCIERSLNGSPLDTLSKEMQAMKSYIEWLGKEVPKGKKPAGAGLKDVPWLDRAADTLKGKIVYLQHCQSCHQADGQGLINQTHTAYIYPPLWGANSYNMGAGLFRISNFAKYVKYNMPQGVSHANPLLTDEQAWDVAAFVNSQPRPVKDFSKDWHKISTKPIDHPFGPFADKFSENQHKYGPFKPMLKSEK